MKPWIAAAESAGETLGPAFVFWSWANLSFSAAVSKPVAALPVLSFFPVVELVLFLPATEFLALLTSVFRSWARVTAGTKIAEIRKTRQREIFFMVLVF